MKTVIPLVGSMVDRDIDANVFAIPTRDQTFQNCLFYPVENPYTGQKTLFVEKRMGIASVGNQDTDYVALTGFYHWKALGTTCRYGYYSPAGNIYRFTPVDSTGTNAVQDTTVSPIFHVSEAKNSSGTPAVFYISAGSANTYTTIYMWADGDAADTHITVPSGSCGHLAHIDGYTFVANTNGRIYNSTLNNPTTGYTDFIGADESPDTLVTVFKHQSLLLAFGTNSMEVFRLGEQSTGSPLQRIPERSSRIGIYKNIAGSGLWASLSFTSPPIVEGNNTVYWLGQSDHGIGVYTLNGFEPKKISTSIQDKYLMNFDGHFKYLQMGQRKLLLIYCTNEWLVYDIEANIWSVWVSAKSASLFSSWINAANGVGLMQALSNSYYIWEPGSTVAYLDGDTSITRLIRTSVIDFDTLNYKDIASLSIIGDRQGSTAAITVSWSKDDSNNFSSGRTIDMSLTQQRLYAIGTGRRWVFRLSDTLQLPARLQALELEYNIHA